MARAPSITLQESQAVGQTQELDALRQQLHAERSRAAALEAQLTSQQDHRQRQTAELTQQAEDRLKAAVNLARAEVGHPPESGCVLMGLLLSCLASFRNTHLVLIQRVWTPWNRHNSGLGNYSPVHILVLDDSRPCSVLPRPP